MMKWRWTSTRPDILFTVHIVSKFMQSPCPLHLCKFILSIYWYFQAWFFFPTSASPQLQAYNNFDWVGCPDTQKSTTGWCMFLGYAPISWKCKKQDLVPKSSTKAKYWRHVCSMLWDYLATWSLFRAWFFTSKTQSTTCWQYKCYSDCNKSCLPWKNEAHKGWLSLNSGGLWP